MLKPCSQFDHLFISAHTICATRRGHTFDRFQQTERSLTDKLAVPVAIWPTNHVINPLPAGGCGSNEAAVSSVYLGTRSCCPNNDFLRGNVKIDLYAHLQ